MDNKSSGTAYPSSDGLTIYQDCRTIAQTGNTLTAEIQYQNGNISFQTRDLSGNFVLNEQYYQPWSNGKNKDGS